MQAMVRICLANVGLAGQLTVNQTRPRRAKGKLHRDTALLSTGLYGKA